MGKHRSTLRARRGLRGGVALFLLAAGVPVLLHAARAGADGPGTIATEGPLTNITISPDLNCSVNHTTDTAGEWYAGTACGTFVATGGTLYGPASIPAGDAQLRQQTYMPFTAVSQTQSGEGSQSAPFVISTQVTLGTSGLTLLEKDSYIVGQESYQTDISVSSTNRAPSNVTIYHGGDCYLQDSDTGGGRVDNGNSPVCVAVPGSTGGGGGAGAGARRAAGGITADATDPARIEGMYPITAGSHYIEDNFSVVWATIGTQESLPDSCYMQCDPAATTDNGLALSWSTAVNASASADVSLLTTFSPAGNAPLAFAKTADSADATTGGTDGYTISVTNPSATTQTLTTITDTLPAGFEYVPHSTSGEITSAEPTIDGRTLTWTGSFDFPHTEGSPGPKRLHFDVIVATTPDTYTNTVTGAGDGVSVVAAVDVAPIDVSAPVVTKPTASDDSYDTPFDTTLTVAAPGVLDNDTSPRVEPNKQVDTESVTQPSHGTVTVDADGSFTYEPTSGFSGADTFTYRMSDGTAESDPATVTITVGANQPPVANDDSYSTDEDTTLDGTSVLANDSDPEHDSLTAVLGTGPKHGTLTLRNDGTFTYVPAANYNGTDTFTYRASDGTHLSGPATVTITVNPVNDPIVAHDDAYTVQQDTTLTVAAPGVLGNDSDPDGRAEASVVDNPGHGQLTLHRDGGFTYVPATGFSGDDTFTYSAGDTSNATVTITVTHVDHAPSAAADTYQTDEGHTLTVAAPGVLDNDSDPDGDSLTATQFGHPAHGTLTANSDGSFSYVPDTNFSGTDSFTYRARAGELTSNLATVTITVTAVDHAPVALGDSYTTPEGTALHVAAPGVLGNDTDPDGDSLTTDLVRTTAHGTLTLGSDGAVDYQPDAGYTGPDSFTYRAFDPSGKHSTRVTVDIDVTPVNHAPVDADDAYSTPQDTTLAVAAPGVLGNDTDPDGNGLTVAQATGPAHGSVQLDPDGALRYVPDAGFSGTDSFTYAASDGLLTSGSTLVRITVVPAVTPPPTHPNHPSTPSQPTQPTQPNQPTQPVTTPTPHPVVQPVVQPVTQPVSQPVSQPSTPSTTPSRGVGAVTLGQLPIGVLSVAPGGTLAIHGSGCPAGSPVTLSLNGKPLAVTTARANGTFATTVTAPQLIGTFPVTARCGDLLLAGRVALVAVTSDSASAGAQAITVGAVLSFFLLLLGLTLRRPMFRA